MDSRQHGEMRYATQALPLAVVAALAGVASSRERDGPGWAKWLHPAAGILAMKAATTAIATCASKGYPVSAVVVDTSGVYQA